MKKAVLRPLAELDLIDIAQWYAERGGEGVAARFFDAAHDAVDVIERNPGIGSLRLGRMAGMDDLRSWQLTGFPVRWFYVERESFIDMVRVLGERQDITAILGADSQ